MAYIQKPGVKSDSQGKAMSIAAIATTGSNLASAGPVSSMSGSEKLAAGGNVVGMIKSLGGLKSETPQIEQLQKPSSMARRLQVQDIQPQETLDLLSRGEQAINVLGRQDPKIFEQYYKPLADTMFAVYNDPRFAQFKNPNYGQQG